MVLLTPLALKPLNYSRRSFRAGIGQDTDQEYYYSLFRETSNRTFILPLCNARWKILVADGDGIEPKS